MSQRFKKPKSFLHQGNPQARLRKSIEARIRTQADLDMFLGAMPEQMRELALERARPYLRFIPLQDQVQGEVAMTDH